MADRTFWIATPHRRCVAFNRPTARLPMAADTWAYLASRQLAVHGAQHPVMHRIIEVEPEAPVPMVAW